MTSTRDFQLFDFTFDKSSVDLTWSLKLSSTWSNHAEHLKGLAQFCNTRYPLLQSGLNTTSLHIKSYGYLVNTLTDKVNICINEKSELFLAGFLLSSLLKVLENSKYHDLISRQSVKKLTTWIIYSSVGKNTSFYICMSKEAIYHKQVVLPIQCELIEKVDYKSWFKRLIIKIDYKDWLKRLSK